MRSQAVNTSVRHVAGTIAEAALVGAIGVALVFGFAVTTGNKPAGAAPVQAASLSATIQIAGNAPQPLPVSNPISFAVTRSFADNTVYWVYNYCYDASNKLLGTEGYPVAWGMWYSLSGTTTSAYTLKGTHCKAVVTIKPSTGRPLGDAILTYTVK